MKWQIQQEDKSSLGEFELETPRDRDSAFQPQIIQKRQTAMTDDLDKKILNLYANVMSYADIREILEEIYQVEISNGTINKITDKLLPELEDWRNRPLASVYLVLYLDAIHFKIRENGKVVSKAIYSLLAINSIFPKTEIQLCIIHQIRNSMRYVASGNQKEFMQDLKEIYRASSKDMAETNLLKLEEK